MRKIYSCFFAMLLPGLALANNPTPLADIDYCESTATVSRVDRYITTLTVGGTEIAGPGKSNPHNLFVDRTSTVVTVGAGEEVEFTAVGGGEWMHAYLYVDFDRNGWNVDESIFDSANGDLVWFNYYRNGDSGNGFNSDGEEQTSAHFDIGGVTGKFRVPANASGEYRVRYKVDWNCVAPCGNTASGNLIHSNGGALIDFTLYVVSTSLDEERTISVAVAEDQEEMGQVSLPDYEGTSVTTDSRHVNILAEAFDGAQFMNWTRNGEVVSSAAKYIASDETDAEYVANFGWTVNYTVGSNGSFQLREEGSDTPLQSGAAVAPGTKLIATATPNNYKIIDEFTDNGHELEVVDGVAEIIVTGPVNINVTFKDAVYALSLVSKGQGKVEVWTGSDYENDEPTGEKIENNGEISARTEYNIYVMPGANGDNSEEITFILIKNGDEEEITLDNADDYGWPCTYNENYMIFPLEATGNLSVEAHFTSNLAAIGDILFDGIEGEVEYFNLQGVRVDAANVESGLYIVRKGDKAAKVFIRK